MGNRAVFRSKTFSQLKRAIDSIVHTALGTGMCYNTALYQLSMCAHV